MKNSKNVYIRTIKYLPFYFISIILLIISQYLCSLITLFIGQSLGIFAGENQIILPKFLSQFIDNSSPFTQLKSLSVIMICVGVVMAIIRLVRTFFRRLFSLNIERDVSLSFFTHALNLPKHFLTSRSTGDIIQRNIQDTKKFTSFVGDSIFSIVYSLTTLGVVLFNIFGLSKNNFLIAVVVSCVVIGFEIIYSFMVIRKQEKILSQLLSDMNTITQQSFSNILMVKTFNGEKKELDKLSNYNNKTHDVKYKVDLIYARYWAVMDIVNILYKTAMILFIAVMFIKDNIGFGVATSLIMYNEEILNSSLDIVNKINKLIRDSVAGGRLNEYLLVPDDYVVNGTLKPQLNGNIDISGLKFRYDNSSKFCLDIDSLNIKQGQTIGVVGKSGSGKSTLLNVLSRLDDYEIGSIKFDGVELKNIEKHYLRQNIGFVNQDSYVFSSTIKDNLIILTNDCSNLENSVEKVCLDDDIAKFPSGYETMIGEKGVTLSGGQKQRISIARTLMKNSKILLLDDCLSAVDNNVSKKIRSSLKNDSSTTIIVSHNLMNVINADNIIVLDKGKIVQQGKHEQLVAVDGIYKDIWDLQQKIKDLEYEKTKEKLS